MAGALPKQPTVSLLEVVGDQMKLSFMSYVVKVELLSCHFIRQTLKLIELEESSTQ